MCSGKTLTGQLLVLLALVGLNRSGARSEDADSEKLAHRVCSNKKVPIQRVDLMKRVIWFTRINAKLCHDDYTASLNELDAILATKDGEICSEKHLDMIRNYHFRFISPPTVLNIRPDKLKGGEVRKIMKRQLHPEPYKYTINLDEHGQPLMIPIALRHFFLAYVLQVSGLCKRAMLKNLSLTASLDGLHGEKHSVLTLMTTDSAMQVFRKEDLAAVNFDNVLYLPELEGTSKINEQDAGKRVHLQTSSTKNSALFEIMLDCRNRLRPIYNSLILPLIKLNKLGYDYRGNKLTEEELAKLEGDDVKTWLSIVHVCEIFHNILVIEKDGRSYIGHDNSNDKDGDGDDDDDDDDDDEDDDIDDDNDNDGDNDEVDANENESDSETNGSEKVALGGSDIDRSQEGVLSVMSEGQVDALKDMTEMNLAEPNVFEPAEPVEPFGNDLWISDESQLDLELSRKIGNSHPFGWRGYMRRTKARLKRAFAKLDFQRFAHYRKHSEWYSGFLNFISSCSNVASITVTIVFMVAPLV